MSGEWSEAEAAAFAKLAGLSHLPREDLERLARIGATVAEAGRNLPRQPGKSDEPAGIFRVPVQG